MNVEQARFNMIEQQVRPWNVLDNHILDLLSRVRREDFCPPAHRGLAFMDLEIPLPCGQHMLAPRVQARLVQDLDLQGQEKVLQVGAGSGYMTALLAHCAQSVVAYEIHPELAALAQANLQKSHATRVDLRTGDGLKGATASGPFDAIVLCGSVPSIPHELLNALKIGGRLMAVVGNAPDMRAHRVTRESETTFNTTQPWDVVIDRLEGLPPERKFKF